MIIVLEILDSERGRQIAMMMVSIERRRDDSSLGERIVLEMIVSIEKSHNESSLGEKKREEGSRERRVLTVIVLDSGRGRRIAMAMMMVSIERCRNVNSLGERKVVMIASRLTLAMIASRLIILKRVAIIASQLIVLRRVAIIASRLIVLRRVVIIAMIVSG
jgi:hypothetical protein